jgi:hypothetical protein
LSGNFALLIDLFISFVIGFTITGLAIFIIFTDTPSKPVIIRHVVKRLLINNQSDVAEIFNNNFVNVAKNIGSESCTVDDNHPSIQAITENCNFEDNLSFTEISDDLD